MSVKWGFAVNFISAFSLLGDKICESEISRIFARFFAKILLFFTKFFAQISRIFTKFFARFFAKILLSKFCVQPTKFFAQISPSAFCVQPLINSTLQGFKYA